MADVREFYQVPLPSDASLDVKAAFNELNRILLFILQRQEKMRGLDGLTPEFANAPDFGGNRAINLDTGTDDSDGVRKDQISTVAATLVASRLVKTDSSIDLDSVASLTDKSLLVADGANDLASLGAATDGQLPIGDTGSNPVLATITGTATQITVTNGAGVITISIPLAAVIVLANDGLRVYDTNTSHVLLIRPGSDITAARTLTLTTGDSDRTITLSGNPTLDDWFDQAVKQADSPTFAGMDLTGLTASLLTQTDGSKNLASLSKQAHIVDASTAHTVADTSETVDRSDIEAKLDAIGTTINAILSALETALLLNTS